MAILVKLARRFLPLPHSIRWRLFWLLGGVSVGAIVVLNLVWLPRALEEVDEVEDEVQRIYVQAIHNPLRQFLGRLEQDLSNSAVQFRIAMHEGDQEALRYVGQKLFQQQTAFEEVGILNAEGRETFRLSRRLAVIDGESSDRSATPLFREGKKKEISWGTVTLTETSEPWVTLAVRTASSGSATSGLVYGVVNLKPLWNLVGEFKVRGEGRVYIVDGNGRLIAASDPSLVLRRLSFAERQLIKELLFFQGSPEASFVHSYYTNELGVKVSGTGMSLASPRWGVVVEQPVSLLYVSIRRKLWFFFGISFIVVLASLILAHFVSRSVTGPITRLREGAEKIAAGKFDSRVRVETDDEVGQLAAQFNQMADALEGSYSNLEQKIARRTQDLTTLYTALTPLAGGETLPRLFEKVIERLVSTTGSDAALIRVLDPEKKGFLCIAQQGYEQELTSSATLHPVDSAAGQVLSSGEPMMSPDIGADPRFKRKRQLRLGFKSCAVLPLIVNGEAIGIIHLFSRSLGHFTEEKKEQSMTIARFMGIVVENFNLLQASKKTAEELTRSNRELASLYAALTPLMSMSSIEELFERINERVLAATAADAARIRILDEETNQFLYLAQRGFTAEFVEESRSLTRDSAVGQVFYEGEPIISPDIAADPRVRRKRQVELGFNSCAFLPLRAKGKTRGVIHLASRSKHFFTEDKRENLLAIAHLMGIVVENYELLQSSVEAAEELKRSNQELEQFAYVASHDLQEPLRMTTSFAQLLARRYKGKLDSQADEFIDILVDGSKRMQRLIQDLLLFSRIGSRGRAFAPTDCGVAMSRVLAFLKGAIEESGARVIYDGLPTVMADESQLEQLLLNLIGNAIKYRDSRPPVIHVMCQKNDDRWLFSVKDNGIGIDPQFAERVFVIFQRLHTREEYQGNGIGLAICKKIVERHGGKIWVESQPGQGAVFHFTLPSEFRIETGERL